MNRETRIYEDLCEHLDGQPMDAQAKITGVKVSILKQLYTPEEAKIATKLSAKPESLPQIYNQIDEKAMSQEELKGILEKMAHKGTVFTKKEGSGEKRYSGSGFFFSGMYAFQADRLTEDLAQDFYEYFYNTDTAKAETALKKRILEFRTVPVEEAIPDKERSRLRDYENVRKMIENVDGRIVLSHCICRQTREYQEEFCTTTHLRETCLVLGRDRVEQYKKMGIGRVINKEEAIEIYSKSQEAGLVIQLENTQQPEFICFCCGDCCAILTSAKKMAHPSKSYATNYYITADPESCLTCGACVERCPMDALTMVNQVPSVDLKRCIGCGNCVTTCGGEVLKLRRKSKEIVPPKSQEDLYVMIL